MKKIEIDKLSQFKFLHKLLHDDIDNEINLLDKHLKFMYETCEDKEKYMNELYKNIPMARSSWFVNQCLTLPNAELSCFDILGDIIYQEKERSGSIDPDSLSLASRRVHGYYLSHMHTIASKYVLLDMLNDYKYLINYYKNSNLILVDDLSNKFNITKERLMNLLRFRMRDGFKLIVYVEKFRLPYKWMDRCLNGVNFIVSMEKNMLNICSFYVNIDKAKNRTDRTCMSLVREKATYNVDDIVNNTLLNLFDSYGNMLPLELGYNIIFNLLVLYLDAQNQRYVERNYQEGRSKTKNQNRIKVKESISPDIHIYDYKLCNTKYIWEKNSKDGKPILRKITDNKKGNSGGLGVEKSPHRRKSHTRQYDRGKNINVKESIIHKDKMDGFSVAHKIKI